jgi:hypothetical protein
MEGTFAVTFNITGGGTKVAKFVRVGKMVTIIIPHFIGTCLTSAPVTNAGTVPAYLINNAWDSTSQPHGYFISANPANQLYPGRCVINGDGSLQMFPSFAGGGFAVGTANCGANSVITFNYSL